MAVPAVQTVAAVPAVQVLGVVQVIQVLAVLMGVSIGKEVFLIFLFKAEVNQILIPIRSLINLVIQINIVIKHITGLILLALSS